MNSTTVLFLFNANLDRSILIFKNSLVIHEGNTEQISTITVTLYLIKLIDVRKNTNDNIFYINEHGILYNILS